MKTEPIISVGILTAKTVRFTIDGKTTECHYDNGRIKVGNEYFSKLKYEPETFTLHDVCIGIGFHWQQTEDQTFEGELEIIPVDGCASGASKLLVINRLPIEKYLFSVIASEMSATSSLELLSAHAIVSRSWLMAQISRAPRAGEGGTLSQLSFLSPKRKLSKEKMYLRWYDREDHTLFDVCADDHCQRYQGLTRANNGAVKQAIEQTRGMVLAYNGQICDARFSKCCGGQTELFSSCWQDIEVPYLTSVTDPFCNTSDENILRQVLNNYDQTTNDFYRWTVRYTQQELTEIVNTKSAIDFGTILDLQPVRRGPSGRIVELKIVGEHRTMIVGKELEIRRLLSPSHLYSSAFTVEREGTNFVLHGRGWGHGVGLCQIGSAVMSLAGYDYKQILQHYFPNAQLEKQW